jgi:hypothetical protein
MNSYKHLYSDVYAFPRLVQAARKARLGERARPYGASFEFRLEEELLRLESELKTSSCPGLSQRGTT